MYRIARFKKYAPVQIEWIVKKADTKPYLFLRGGEELRQRWSTRHDQIAELGQRPREFEWMQTPNQQGEALRCEYPHHQNIHLWQRHPKARISNRLQRYHLLIGMSLFQ